MLLKTISERRSAARFEVCLDAVWDGTRGADRARITDLSETGCYVDSICEASEGEILHLKAQMPNGEWLDLVGEVAYTSSRLGFGLKFVQMDLLQREKVRRFIRGLDESNYPTLLRICA